MNNLNGFISVLIFMIAATLNYFILGVDDAEDFLIKLWLMVLGWFIGTIMLGLFEKVK